LRLTTQGGRGVRAARAGLVAGLVAGAPSTLHALVRGRDPLEATLAAGSILLPGETRRGRLVAAAVPVHLAISAGWALVLDRTSVRGPVRGALAGLAVAGLDLAAARLLFPRFRHLPVRPQLADHALYGAVAATLISRRDSG
jgi:hypothetical protein